MKYTLAVAALLNGAEAIKIKDAPDVYGPEGENYHNMSADQELADIGINIHEAGSGPNCAKGDWTTVHWTGTLKDGRVITDSRSEPGGLPKTFALGASEVFKCWDLAIPQLKKGAKAHVTCPPHYVYNDAYTQSPLGGEPIPLNSAVDFDLEVVECNKTPTFTEQVSQPVTTTMQPGRCMYLHFGEAEENTAYNLVLSTEDHAWPDKYTILEHWVREDPSQSWFYNEADGSLHTQQDPSMFLTVDSNHWGQVSPLRGGQPTRWFYKDATHAITTTVGGTEIELHVHDDHPQEWSWVDAKPHDAANMNGANNSMFRIEYCWKNF